MRHDAVPAARRGRAVRGLRGSASIAEPLHVSADGNYSWEEVECLGACVNAPMVLIWNDTYEDLTAESFEKVLDGFTNGKPAKPGPQIDRHFSAPIGGATTLTDPALYANGDGGDNTGPALTDADAKKPGAAANVRETPRRQAGHLTGRNDARRQGPHLQEPLRLP